MKISRFELNFDFVRCMKKGSQLDISDHCYHLGRFLLGKSQTLTDYENNAIPLLINPISLVMLRLRV